MEEKKYNENTGAGKNTDTRLKSNPILRFGMYATLIEIENAIICNRQEIEANLKYNRPVKLLKKQTRLLKILLQEARDKV